MAFPVVESVTETGVGDEYHHYVNMPAAVDSGDLLIIISQYSGVDTSVSVSGWTKITQYSTNQGCGVWAKVSDGTEGGTTVDIYTNDRDYMAARTIRISGWYGSIGGIEGGNAYSSGTTQPNPPSLTATWGSADNLWIAAEGNQNSHDTPTSYPTNYTDGDSNTAGGCGCATCFRENATATEDPGVFTLTGSEACRAYTLVIRPEAAATGTNMQINIGDDWKAIAGMQINIGDDWKAVAGAQINIGDTWKTIF